MSAQHCGAGLDIQGCYCKLQRFPKMQIGCRSHLTVFAAEVCDSQ